MMSLRRTNNKMNYYDYILFPQKDIREEVREKYFNIHNLRLNMILNDLKYYTKKHNLNGVILETKKGSVYEIITEFNNNISYLDIPLLEMYNYYYLMTNSLDDEEKSIYDILFRQRCRNLSCELFIYEEKIKNILRNVLHFDLKKTKNDNAFYKALNQAIANSDLGKSFKATLDLFHDDAIIQKLRLFRNNEVHNSSNLLLYFTNKNEKENIELFDNMKYYLQELLKVKSAFEDYLKSII